MFMAIAIDTRQTDFSEMDNAGISKLHWKIMLISGMDFYLAKKSYSINWRSGLKNKP
jgi:hypothetical protein